MDSLPSSPNFHLGTSPPSDDRRGSNSSDEKQRRREQIVLWVILGQACIRGYLTRLRFKGWTREYRVRMHKRNQSIKQLIKMQEKYVTTLRLLEQCYIQPLMKISRDDGAVSVNEINNLFATLKASLADHEKGLTEIVNVWNVQFPLVDGMGAAVDRLVKNSMRSYLNHADKAEQMLANIQLFRERKGFAEIIAQGNMHIGEQGIDLETLVRYPFQHLSQLGVSIEDVVELTPAGHCDARTLKAAALSAKRTAAKGQVTAEEAHARSILARIAPSISGFDLFTTPEGGKKVREFIREGTVAVNGDNRTYVFLFNDVLLATVPQKVVKTKLPVKGKVASPEIGRLPKQAAYKVAHEIQLKEAKVGPATKNSIGLFEKKAPGKKSSATDVNSCIEILNNGGEKYLLSFLSTDERHIWNKELKDLTHRLTFRGAFGMALEELLSAERDRNLGVPYVVFSIVNYLYTYAIAIEDLFTKPGSAAEVDELRHSFDTLDKATGMLDLSSVNPHNASDVLKMYLRELPEPLLTHSMYQEIVGLPSPKESPKEVVVKAFKTILTKLPAPNKILLQYIVHFLCHFSFSAEVNRMNPSTLALVYGPELIRPKEVTFESYLMFGKIQRVVQTFIELYLDIFF